MAAIVGYSGMLTGASELAHAAITKPPILLVHGSADPIVPVVALRAANADLKRIGIEAITHVSAGLSHSVDPSGCDWARISSRKD